MATPFSVVGGSDYFWFFGDDYSGGTWTADYGGGSIVQATGNRQPTSQALPSGAGNIELLFDGVDDYMVGTLASSSPTGGYRLEFAIVTATQFYDAGGGNNVWWRKDPALTPDALYVVSGGGDDKKIIAQSGAHAYSNNIVTVGKRYRAIVYTDLVAGTVTLYIDGVAQTTTGHTPTNDPYWTNANTRLATGSTLGSLIGNVAIGKFGGAQNASTPFSGATIAALDAALNEYLQVTRNVAESISAPTDAVTRSPVAYARGIAESFSAPTDAVARAATYVRAAGGPISRAALTLEGWWRNYASGSWSGTASGGGSASRTLAVNGAVAGGGPGGTITTSVDLDGVDDNLHVTPTSVALSTFVSATKSSGWCLFYADAIAATSSNTNSQNWILGTNGTGQYSVSLRNMGNGTYTASLRVFDSGGDQVATCSVTLGTWTILQWKHSSAGPKTLKIRASTLASTGAWASLTPTGDGAVNALSAFLRIGQSASGGPLFFNGRIAELALAKLYNSDALDDQILESIRSDMGAIVGDKLAAPTDAAARVAAIARSVSETEPAPTDAVVRALTYVRSLDEAEFAPTDAASRMAAYSRESAESELAPTDDVARAATYARVPEEDTAIPTDVAARSTDASRSIGESIAAVADAVERSITRVREIAETVAAPSDAVARLTSVVRVLAESLATSDDASRTVGYVRDGAEGTAAPSGDASRTIGVSRSVAEDAQGVSDAVARAIGVIRAAGETIAAPSGIASRVAAYVRVPAESGSAPVDGVARVTDVSRNAGESIAAPSDEVARLNSYLRSLAESVPSPSDAMVRVLHASRGFADAVGAPLDAVDRVVVLARAALDSIGAPVDAVSRGTEVIRAETENVPAPSDAFTRVAGYRRGPGEDVSTPSVGVARTAAVARVIGDLVKRPLDAVFRRHVVLRTRALIQWGAKVATLIAARHAPATIIVARLSMGPYHVGDPVNIDIEFKDPDFDPLNPDHDQEYVDPPVVSIRVRPEGQALVTYTYGTDLEVTRSAAGKYRARIVLTSAGQGEGISSVRWDFAIVSPGPSWQGTEPGYFDVEPVIGI